MAGYDASLWLALLAPAGTPHEIVAKLNAEVAKLPNTPETRKALFDAGVEPAPSTPEAMSEDMVQLPVPEGGRRESSRRETPPA